MKALRIAVPVTLVLSLGVGLLAADGKAVFLDKKWTSWRPTPQGVQVRQKASTAHQYPRG